MCSPRSGQTELDLEHVDQADRPKSRGIEYALVRSREVGIRRAVALHAECQLHVRLPRREQSLLPRLFPA
jgi:hypothetical protein